jgi:hypothetical protein
MKSLDFNVSSIRSDKLASKKYTVGKLIVEHLWLELWSNLLRPLF